MSNLFKNILEDAYQFGYRGVPEFDAVKKLHEIYGEVIHVMNVDMSTGGAVYDSYQEGVGDREAEDAEASACHDLHY